MNKEKKCKKCNEVKTTRDFYAYKKKGFTYYQGLCMDCHNKKSRERYYERKEFAQ